MVDAARESDFAHLLWTGGWDSTFRLLELVLVRQRPVRPYYLVDTARRSFGTEILAMNAIKRRLAETRPDRIGLVRPTVMRDVLDIPPDPEIAAIYRRFCDKVHIGVQYEWGARFARSEGLSALELSLISGGHMFEIFKPYLRREVAGNDVTYAIDRQYGETDLYRLFGDYRFPLIMTTKQEMLVRAREHGFEDLMTMTVFCHTPRQDGRPCGLCIPCGIAIDHGLGWRLSRASRRRNRWQRRYRKARHFLERFPRVFPLAQRIARSLKRTGKRATPVG